MIIRLTGEGPPGGAAGVETLTLFGEDADVLEEVASGIEDRLVRVPGVLAVLTGEDAAADGLGPMPHNADWKGPPDAELRLPDGLVTDH